MFWKSCGKKTHRLGIWLVVMLAFKSKEVNIYPKRLNDMDAYPMGNA